MAVIKFIQTATAKKDSDWELVGKVWKHKTKADVLTGKFGNKVKDKDGVVQDVFEELTIKPGDPLVIRPNTRMRSGKRDPQYLMYMLKSAAK